MDGNELGRFSNSTAQDPTLVPCEGMLRRHALKCSTMPNRYFGSAAVMGAFDRLCRVQRVLRNALALVRVEPAWLYHEDPWALFRQPAVSHPTVVDAPPPGVPLLT